MLIYHGTNSRAAESILKTGLRPRAGSIKSQWDKVPSKCNLVYLTDAYAGYFAVNASMNAPQSPYAVPAILEIDTDKLDHNRFCPDEDYIAQILWQGKEHGEIITNERLARCKTLKEMTKAIDPVDYQKFWSESLAGLGTVAYYGCIPACAITRIVQWDMAARFINRELMNPIIHIMNYKLKGEFYRSLNAFLFDGTSVKDNDFGLPDFLEWQTERQKQLNAERSEFVKVQWREEMIFSTKNQ